MRKFFDDIWLQVLLYQISLPQKDQKDQKDPSRISTWTMMDYFQQCWIYVYIFDDSSDEPFFSSEYWIQYLLEERWIWNEMNEWHAASAFHVAVSALASLAAAIIFDSRPAWWDGHVSEPLELQNESTWLDLLLHLKRRDMYSYGISCWNLHIPWYGKLDGPQQKMRTMLVHYGIEYLLEWFYAHGVHSTIQNIYAADSSSIEAVSRTVDIIFCNIHDIDVNIYIYIFYAIRYFSKLSRFLLALVMDSAISSYSY